MYVCMWYCVFECVNDMEEGYVGNKCLKTLSGMNYIYIRRSSVNVKAHYVTIPLLNKGGQHFFFFEILNSIKK